MFGTKVDEGLRVHNEGLTSKLGLIEYVKG